MSEPERRVDPEHPWPALLAFTESDQEFFGGRKEEVEALFRRIVSSRLTLLFGISGIGKSSLLRAGLFPRLRAEHYFPIYIRLRFGRDLPSPLEQIKTEIEVQARASSVDAPPPEPNEPLWQYFQRADFWDARNYPCTPVLVFDQFEELFTKSREVQDEANALVEELADLAEGASPALEHPYRLLIGIRADYLARLQAISDRVRAVFANRYELRRMNGAAALESTLTAGGHLVEADVARRIVRFVAGAPDGDGQSVDRLEVEPALLSLVCSELNATRIANGEKAITASMLSGSKDEILSRFYEASFADVAPELRVLVEDKLVTRDGRARNFISEQTARETAGVTDEDLAKLVHRRLLRFEESGASRRMELTHDLLTTVAAASRATREHRRQVEEAEQARAAAEQREAAARRALRRSYLVLAGFLLVLIAAIVGPIIAARWTATGAKRVEADSAFRLALQKLTTDEPAEGLAYLARVIRLDRGNTAARTLLFEQLATRSWPVPVRTFGPAERISEAVFTSDGTSVVFRVGESLEMWDLAKGTLIGRMNVDPDQRIALSSQGSTLMNVGQELVLWNPHTGLRVTRADVCKAIGEPLDGCVPRVTDVSIRQEIAIGDQNSGLRIVPLRGGPIEQILPAYSHYYGEARFGPDPRFVATHRASELSKFIDRAAPTAEASHAGEYFPGGSFLGFSRDGKRVLIRRDLTRIEPWDVEKWASAGAKIDNQSQCRSAMFDPLGETILTTAVDDGLRVWNASDGTGLVEPFWHPGLQTAGFSADGARIYSVSDRQARWWNASSGTMLGAPIVEPKLLAAHPDPRGNLVTVSPAGARVWEMATTLLPPVSDREFSSSLLSTDRTKLKVGDDVLDVATGRQLWSKPDDAEVVAFDRKFTRVIVRVEGRLWVAETPSWKRLWALPPDVTFADLSDDGSAVLFDNGHTAASAADGKLLVPRSNQPGGWRLEDASRDGLILANAVGDGKIEIWDVRRRRAVVTFPAAEVFDLSDDGSRLVAVSPREGVRVWNLATGEMRRLQYEEEKLDSVRFSPDSRFLAGLSENGVVLCDAGTLDCTGELLAYPGVEEVEFSADGERIMTLRGTELRVWETASRRPVTLDLPGNTVLPAGLSPDGSFLVSDDFGGTYRLPLPLVDDEDAERLASLGEALAGIRIDRLGVTKPVDGTAALAEVKKRCRGVESAVCALVGWFAAPAAKRTISPVSNRSVASYLRKYGEEPPHDMWWFLKARFPYEPSLGDKPKR